MLLELVKIYKVYYSNTTFVKVKYKNSRNKERKMNNSNTTFVKVKSAQKMNIQIGELDSNTTFVKVKLFTAMITVHQKAKKIQIQHLLKLNAVRVSKNLQGLLFKYNIC